MILDVDRMSIICTDGSTQLNFPLVVAAFFNSFLQLFTCVERGYNMYNFLSNLLTEETKVYVEWG